MTTRRLAIPVLLLLALTCASLAFFIYYGQDFPPTMAVHFGADGQADGYMDRVKFIVLGSFVSFMLPMVIAAVGILPRVVGWSILSIPNKSFWVETPERRDAAAHTLLWANVWLACLAQVILIGVNIAVMLANRVSPPRLVTPGLFGVGVLILVGVAAWVVLVVRAFAVPRANLR